MLVIICFIFNLLYFPVLISPSLLSLTPSGVPLSSSLPSFLSFSSSSVFLLFCSYCRLSFLFFLSSWTPITSSLFPFVYSFLSIYLLPFRSLFCSRFLSFGSLLFRFSFFYLSLSVCLFRSVHKVGRGKVLTQHKSAVTRARVIHWSLLGDV